MNVHYITNYTNQAALRDMLEKERLIQTVIYCKLNWLQDCAYGKQTRGGL